MKKIFLTFLCLVSIISTIAYGVETNNDMFENKNILILGGTGYLGRAIATEVLKYNPKKIIIFSRDEVKHFNLTKIFGNKKNVESVIGDIRDYDALLRATKSIDIVFHVAALKRMDALEYNVSEALKTNALASLNVFNACVTNNVPRALFISTDKACLPINTYGACKFLSEKIFTNYDTSKISTKFMVTRFGNILDSTGSVIPIFIDKIKNGEEIPLTDDRMTRFIIGKAEATELIFDALRYGIGGEIFIKKLPAMRIIDLIDVLKEKFKANNKVKLIGMRPGEKFHELLVNESEMARAYEFNGIFIIKPSVDNMYTNSNQEPPIYRIKGKSVDLQEIYSYSSDQAVISKGRLLEHLEELQLL